MYVYDNISLSSSENEKYFRKMLNRKSKGGESQSNTTVVMLNM